MDVKEFKGDQIIMAGVVLGGLYVLYQAIQGIKSLGQGAASAAAAVGKGVVKGAQFVTSPVSTGIAAGINAVWQTWDWATNANMVPSGNIVMPDGTTIPMSQVGMTFNDQYGVGQFNYNSRAYIVAPNPNGPAYDNNGNYHAVAWDTYAASLGT